MSYVSKYISTIVDYFGKTFHIKLKKDGWTGGTTTIDNGNATLNYRGDKDSDSNIIPSDVVYEFYSKREDNNKYDEIFESEYKDWQLEITAVDKTLVNNGYGLDSSNPSATLSENFTSTKKWSLTNSPGENKPFNLSMTHTGNNYTLHWNNSSFNFTPQSFLIVSKHFQYIDSIPVNAGNLTSYTFNDLGVFPDTYHFTVAACRIVGGVQPAEFSPRLSTNVTNFNIPFSLTAITSGNSIVLRWLNPTYSITVQSFSINRLRLVAGLWQEGTILTFNDNGSATSYVDSHIGLAHSGATYKYQIAVAPLPDGFERQTFSDYSNSTFVSNTTVPPNIWFNGSYALSNKFYGSQVTAPQLRVSGGSGTVIVNYQYGNAAVPGAFVTTANTITATGSSFTIYLPGVKMLRGSNGANFTEQINLLTGVTYHRSVSNTNVSRTMPGRSFISGMTANQVGNDVHLSWTQIVDPNTDVIYGYAIQRFLTSDFGNTRAVIHTNTGTTNTTYVDVNAPKGGYTYYVQSASIDITGMGIGTFSDWISQASDLISITIT
jgi:hypothetical protein